MKRMRRCTSRMCKRPVPAGVDAVRLFSGRVLVTVPAADALVAPGTECPPAVSRRRSVARQEDATYIGCLAGMVQSLVQLVDRVGPKGVADVGTVEGHPH